MSRLQKSPVNSDHTIKFTTPSGVTDASDTIEITFPAGFSVTSVDVTDIDLHWGPSTGLENSATLAAAADATHWGAYFTGQVLSFDHATDGAFEDIATTSKVVVEIGTNATGGDQQIDNHATAATYTISIGGDFGDTGKIAVVILDNDQFTVSASVDPTITFSLDNTATAFGTLSGTIATSSPNVTLTVSTNTSSSSKISLKKLEEMFTYPTGTLTATDHTEKFGAKSELGFTTADKLKTVYDYYLNLATKQNLTVSRKTLEPDLSSAAITIQGKDYYVDISLYQYENTEFTVSIYGDNITNDTANTTTSTNTGTSTPTSNSSKATISNEYVISDSNTRVITTAELTSLTPWQLKVARNEIYARHGREFVHKDLQCYFGGKSWYKVDPNFIESVLSTTENKNIATIQSYEQSISSPLASKDSGC